MTINLMFFLPETEFEYLSLHSYFEHFTVKL